MRRSHGGMRRSSATSKRSGSGPPSISSRPPREPSTRIASPCPTSRIDTRGDEAGRAATTLPATATATISPAAAARLARRPVSWAAFVAGFDDGADGRSHRALDRRVHTSPAAPPGDRHETDDRDAGRDDVERWHQRDARERKTGRRLDDEDEDAQDHPTGRGDDGSQDRRRAGCQGGSAGQGEDARRHRWGDQAGRRRGSRPARGPRGDRTRRG